MNKKVMVSPLPHTLSRSKGCLKGQFFSEPYFFLISEKPNFGVRMYSQVSFKSQYTFSYKMPSNLGVGWFKKKICSEKEWPVKAEIGHQPFGYLCMAPSVAAQCTVPRY